jgi:RNA polymerase sigma-70 factor (ECF subfamily)
LLSSRLAPDDVSPGAGLGIPELTRRLAAGDEAAYRVFYDAYFDRLWRYLLVVTGGDEDAVREALQSAMVRVVRHVKVFPDDAVFWGWLTVLARSALADQNRKRHRYLAFLDRFTLHAEIQKATGEPREPGPDLLARLEGNLSTLPADERQLLEWKYNGRRPVRAIAAELGVSEKAVESRLSRIRRKLKEALLKGANDE